MDYLTRYYRNLCEQLQQQVNILSNQLNVLNEMDSGGNPYDANPYLPYVPGGPDIPNPKPPFVPPPPPPPEKPPPRPTPTPEPVPGPGYRFPTPPQFIPGQPIDPDDYFPEGLGPITPPNPEDYPKGRNDPDYKRDMELWKRARAIYDAHVRRSRTPRAKPYYRGGAGGGGLVTP